MEFHELGTYKDKIKKIFFDDEVLKSIVMPELENPDYDEKDNWYGGDNLETYVDGSVEYNDIIGHCFDVPFIYAPVTDTRMCLCVDAEIYRWEGQSIKEVLVTIYVMCHKDIVKMDNKTKIKYVKKHNLAGNKIDMAVEQIGNLLNGSNDFGIGRIEPFPRKPVTSYYPNDKFFGKILMFKCSDFSTDYTKRG